MRVLLATLLLVISVIKADAVCLFGVGSDCPLSDSEAEKQIRQRIDGKNVGNQVLHFSRVIQNRVEMPGAFHIVDYEYELAGQRRQGYAGFNKCSNGWCIGNVCLQRQC